jgi:DNA-directed RNA polymerase subunit E'/Rpb7
MATTQRNYPRKRPAGEVHTEYSVYVRNMISMKIHLKMSEVGDSTKMNLERKIVRRTEGKCIPEGYVRPDSVKIVTYSSGVIKMNMIEFQVVFECLICNPVEGMIVECATRTITKAGIHADVITDKGFLPMKVFVARDHNYANRGFGTIKENTNIKVRIIGKRFELNDPYIVAIASLVDSSGKDREFERVTQQNMPKITVLPDKLESDEEDADVEELETEAADKTRGPASEILSPAENPEIGARISLPTAHSRRVA